MRRDLSTGYSSNEYRLRRGGEVQSKPRCNCVANKSAIPWWWRSSTTIPLISRIFLVGFILLGFSLRGLTLLLHFNIDFCRAAYSDAAGKCIQMEPMEEPIPRMRDDTCISRRIALSRTLLISDIIYSLIYINTFMKLVIYNIRNLESLKRII